MDRSESSTKTNSIKSTAVVTKFLLQMFDAAGLDTDLIVRTATIGTDVVSDEQGRIPHQQILRMWDAAMEQSEDRDFGLHLAATVRTVPFNTAGYLAMSAQTLRNMLESIGRYVGLFSDMGRFELVESGSVAVVTFDLSGGLAPNRTHSDFWMIYFIRSVDDLVGWKLPILEIGFRHAEPQDTSEYERVLPANYRFGQRDNYFTFDKSFLDRENLNADPVVHQILEDQANRQLNDLKGQAVLQRVRRAIFDAFPASNIELEGVAASLGMTARTIQRHLAKDKTSFRQLVDQSRRDYAESTLRETDQPISEIAYRLGYLDLSSFYRAFKRWNGTTPVEFRERGRHL